MFRPSGIATFVGLLFIALIIWGGWWWLAATAQKEGVLAWMESRRDAGWAAETAEASVSGFPNRLDLTLEKPIVADPKSGWAWSAPALHLHQLSYRPDQAIVTFPGTQSFAVPGGRMEVKSEDLRASLAIEPGLSLRLRNAILEGVKVEASGVAAGGVVGVWSVGAEKLVAALREAEVPLPADGPNAYDVSLTASQVTPPEALTSTLGLGAALPATAAELLLDATLGFAQPLALKTAEAGGPRLTSVRVKPSRLAWGPLSLRAQGELAVDAQGYPEGVLMVRAENWRAALDAAVAAGAVSRRSEETIRSALEVISFLSGKGNGLEAPLRFAGGRVFVGPAPIGKAPRLTLKR